MMTRSPMTSLSVSDNPSVLNDSGPPEHRPLSYSRNKMKLKLQYNYDNFCKMQDEVEELRDLVLKLNARITIQDKPDKVKTSKKQKTQPKEEVISVNK